MSNVDEEEQYYVLEIVSDSLRSQSELPEKKREVLATLVDEVKTSLGCHRGIKNHTGSLCKPHSGINEMLV